MGQCQATTKDGSVCEIPTPEGEKFCHIHLKEKPIQRFLSKRFWRQSLTTSFFVIVLSFLANVTGLLSFFGVTPNQQPTINATSPAIPTNPLKPCVATPVAIPTNIPNTAPLAIVPPVPNYCDEAMDLASYLAGNAVQAFREVALENDKTNSATIFRGKALAMVQELRLLTQLAIMQSNSQNMDFDLDPLSSKITKIEIIDKQTIDIEVCMIGKQTEIGADSLATPMIGYALLEMQIQKIGSAWYIIDIPKMSAPNSC